MKKFENACKKIMVCSGCGENLIKVNEIRMGQKRTDFYTITGGFYLVDKEKICVGCYKKELTSIH